MATKAPAVRSKRSAPRPRFSSRTSKTLVKKYTEGRALTPSEKRELELPLTADEIQLVRSLTVLDKFETAIYLRKSPQWVEKEGNQKHKLPPICSPPGTKELLWRREDLDRALEAWTNGVEWNGKPRRGGR